MTMGPDQESLTDGDPCVAEFLARHGIAKQAEAEPETPNPNPPTAAPSPVETMVFDESTEQTIEQKLGLATAGVKAVAQDMSGATVSINNTPAPNRPAARPTPTTTTQTPPQAAARKQQNATARPAQLPARRKRDVADQKSADAMRQLRSVANSISVSISRSNQVKEKLNEAARFLAIAMIAGLSALGLAYFTSTARSFIFFAAVITLVLGLLCAYRTTMIMTRLRRVAKL